MRSEARASWKQAAKRSTKPMARSVAPSSRAPASDVIAPPVNEATTERPSTGAKTSCSGLHCVGIGEFLWPEPSRCSTTTLPQSEPRCTSACEIYGLAVGGVRPIKACARRSTSSVKQNIEKSTAKSIRARHQETSISANLTKKIVANKAVAKTKFKRAENKRTCPKKRCG